MMVRPYLSFGAREIEALLDEHADEPHVLAQVLDELRRRKSEKAQLLLSRVEKRLAELKTCEEDPENGLWHAAVNADPTAPTARPSHHDQPGSEADIVDTQNCDRPPDDLKRPLTLSRMRPPSTTGLPNPWVRSLDQDMSLDLPENAEFPDVFTTALGELIAEIKRTGAGQKRYELDSGVRVDARAGDTLYSFPFAEEADLFGDAQIEVEVSTQRVEGSVASISSGQLLLALKIDLT